MSYFGYVLAAYAVFAIVLLWDFAVPQLQVRRELRAARLRATRESAPGPAPTGPLELKR